MYGWFRPLLFPKQWGEERASDLIKHGNPFDVLK